MIFPIQAELWPIFSQISLLRQPMSVVVEFMWRHWIARPKKPRVGRKCLWDVSCLIRIMDDLVSNFVAVAAGFFWHPSIARPRKPPVIHKDLADISYISQVIADIVPDFCCFSGVISSHRPYMSFRTSKFFTFIFAEGRWMRTDQQCLYWLCNGK